MDTGLKFLHLAPFSHKAFDTLSAILHNAAVFWGKPCKANDIPPFSEPQRENFSVHPQPAAVAHWNFDPRNYRCRCAAAELDSTRSGQTAPGLGQRAADRPQQQQGAVRKP